MAIEFKNVSFQYPNGFLANENLSLNIEEGERVAIVGQNGAGKTTAVKLMNGLHKPTEGDVFVNGINTKDRTTAQIAKYVGYVFQNPDEQIFNPDVRSEVSYMPRHLKMEDDEVIRRIRWAMELTGVRKYQKVNPLDLPYPIRKFVTIAAVIAMEPQYIILDEPTAGQDLRGIEILEQLLDELQKKGTSVITITHDMEFVAKNFERVIAMANKKIIADGNVKDIFWNQKVLSESKIKKPQMAELAERLKMTGNIIYMDELIRQIGGKNGENNGQKKIYH